MDQNYPQCCWLKLATRDDVDVVPLTDIIDVNRDAGISANTIFLHQRDQLGLRQIVGWTGLTFAQPYLSGHIKVY